MPQVNILPREEQEELDRLRKEIIDLRSEKILIEEYINKHNCDREVKELMTLLVKEPGITNLIDDMKSEIYICYLQYRVNGIFECFFFTSEKQLLQKINTFANAILESGNVDFSYFMGKSDKLAILHEHNRFINKRITNINATYLSNNFALYLINPGSDNE